MNIITDSSFSKATDPDIALDRSSVWISQWPWWHHDPWTPTWYQTATGPWASMGPTMVAGIMDIILVPGHYRAMDPDKVLGSSQGLDISMTSGGILFQRL